MSEWYEAEKDDIEIDHTANEVNILVTSNENGSIYLILSFDQIRQLRFDIGK